MLRKILVLTLLYVGLYANTTLDDTYYIQSRDINISTIISHVKNDFEIYTIERTRESKRVKAKDLIKLLKEHGYKNYTFKGSYITFILKSPIDTSKIELMLKEHYKSKYDEINIENISVHPRSYTETLPQEYKLSMRSRDYLSRSGTLNIKTPENKRIFFDYDIKATIPIYISRKKIKKDVELSAINSIKKSIILDKFRAKPIQKLQSGLFQSKHHIAKNKILTIRDVEVLSVVKQNSFVNVYLNNDNMAITFSARALQDGKMNDVIRVQKSDGTRLKVIVVGKNRAEIRWK